MDHLLQWKSETYICELLYIVIIPLVDVDSHWIGLVPLLIPLPSQSIPYLYSHFVKIWRRIITYITYLTSVLPLCCISSGVSLG